MGLSELLGRSAKDQLRRIEIVTDAELAHLDLGELLAELLDRVKGILEADTAAILLVDSQRQELIATAARGIEEEVYEGVRIPVGKGFAGRIARLKKPLIIDAVDATNVVNPILLEKAICSLLGVPLLVEGGVLGVLHVGTLTSRQFTDKDADLLRMVADRVALAVQSRVSQNDRAAAQALQSSLLPTALPIIPGLQFAARYLPAQGEGMGGDWYDLFTLPSGRLALAIGDVVGHGLDAALIMGRLRAALRVCSFYADDPAEVLEHLDRQIQHFEPGVMATLLYATLDPSLERVHLSSAGHPLPVLALPEHPAAPLDIPIDFPLGVRSKRPRRTTTTSLLPGAVITMYTDGLVERRGSVADTRLQQLYKVIVAGCAEMVCNTVMHSMIDGYATEDDAAVLVMRREHDPQENLDGRASAQSLRPRHIRETVTIQEKPAQLNAFPANSAQESTQ